MNTLYEHWYYVMRETKKPVYLVFYDLERKDLQDIECYLEQTVRYDGKWFFVKAKTTYFGNERDRDAAFRLFIKFLYKKPIPIAKFLFPVKEENQC